MNKLILALLLIFECSATCFSQGLITRPTKQERQISKPTKQTQIKPAKQTQIKPAKQARPAKVSKTDGIHNGHEWVDLGLPSGLKWATCNIGAPSPKISGSYFAWGETSPKSSYDERNGLTYGKSIYELKSAGIINSSGILELSHDAARINWGGKWRIPTRQEYQELKEKCKWTWIINGYEVTGPNGRSIFLPAAGFRFANIPCGYTRGYYWSSSALSDKYNSWNFILDSNQYFLNKTSPLRECGLSIRPILE